MNCGYDCLNCKLKNCKYALDDINDAGKEFLKKKDKIRHAKYYQENKEEVKEKSARYRQENKEKDKARHAKYYEKNKENINKKNQMRYNSNIIERRKKAMDYYNLHKDEINARRKELRDAKRTKKEVVNESIYKKTRSCNAS